MAEAQTPEGSRTLTPEEEQTLGAVIALAAYRTFDGNEPSGAHGLSGQLVGLRARDGSSPWRLELLPGETSGVDLPDGPIPGRYFAGANREVEIVVSVDAGLLSSIECVPEPGHELTAWPSPGEITPW